MKNKFFLTFAILLGIFIHAQRGNVGINTTEPTNTLHVKSNSDPLRLEGLNEGVTEDKVVLANFDGILKTKDMTTVSSYAEPWNMMNTYNPATANSQNIYTMGEVGIGTNKSNIMNVAMGNSTNITDTKSKIAVYLDASQYTEDSKYKSIMKFVVDNSNGKGYDDTAFYSFGTGPIGPYITDIKYAARGISTAPQPLNNNDKIYQLTSSGYLGGNYNAFVPLALYQVTYAGDGTNNLTQTDIHNSGRSAIKISSNNNVGINYNPTAKSNLYVNGSVGAKVRPFSGQILDDDFTILATGNVSLPSSTLENQGRMYIIGYQSSTPITISGRFFAASTFFDNYTLDGTPGKKSIMVVSLGNAWMIVSAF